MKTKVLKPILILIGIITLSACGSITDKLMTSLEKDIDKKSDELLKKFTDIPSDLKGKWTLAGNPDADIVIINTAGGPVTTSMTIETIMMVEGQAKTDLKKVLLVEVKQYQAQYPEKFKTQSFSFEEAKEFDKKSVKDLAQTIQYFKNKGKKIYVLGISFGAFVVEDLLANYQNIADKYMVIVGRLKMPNEVWEQFAQGKYVGFKYDKQGNFTIVEVTSDEAGMGAGELIEDQNMSKLAAGLGHHNYINLLKNKDLSNVIYAYGYVDEEVGRLSKEEIDFLKSKNVKIIKTDKDHSGTIDIFMDKHFKNNIK